MVCLCMNVTEIEITQAISTGASTVDALGDLCLAGTGCGCCHDALEQLLRSHPADSSTDPERNM